MTAALADIRDAVKADLRETGAGDWTDAQVDRAIAQALADYSRDCPFEKTVTTSPTSRTLDLATVLGAADFDQLVRITGVEYPVNEWPPIYVHFATHGGKLDIHSEGEPGGASDAAITYLVTHTLTAATSTVPGRDADLLALGASAYALSQLAVGGINTIPLSPTAVPQLRALATERRHLFTSALARARGVVSSRRFRPVDPYPTSQDIVTWPD